MSTVSAKMHTPPDAMVTVRLAERHEAGVVADILLAAFGEIEDQYTPGAFEVVTPSAEEVASRFDEGPIWLAEVDGKPVGTVSVLPEPEWLYIRSMAVLPEGQGRGIAGMLLDSVEKYAIAEGFEKLFLYVTNFSQGAIGLYEKHGFTLERYTTAEEWFGTAGRSMEKSLVGK